MAVKLVHGYCRPLIRAAHSPLEIARLGGIQAHVTAIKEHPTHAVVQEEACGTLLTLAAGDDENRAQITGGGGGEEQVRRAKAAANTTENTKKWGQMLLNRLAQCWKIKNNEGCHRRVLASCPRPRRLLGRITSHSRHTDGRHHTEGDQARVLLTHTNADRARDVTVAVRASVRAWRMSTACMTTCIWLTFSWLTCSWLTCSDMIMIVLCSTRVITAFLTELGEGKLLGPDSAWQRSLQQQAWALHAAQVMIMLPV